MTHLTYLLFELGWALPVLALQWLAGGRVLWRQRRVLIQALVITTLYLSLTDAVAISHGIWVFHPARLLGARVGDLPLEELLFFLLTNAMVVQTVILARDLRQVGIARRLTRRLRRRSADAA